MTIRPSAAIRQGYNEIANLWVVFTKGESFDYIAASPLQKRPFYIIIFCRETKPLPTQAERQKEHTHECL